jgi:hypothetical protein
MGAYQNNLVSVVGTPPIWYKLDVDPWVEDGTATFSINKTGTINLITNDGVDTACANPQQGSYLQNASSQIIAPIRSIFTLNFWFKKNSLPSAKIQYIELFSTGYTNNVNFSFIDTNGTLTFNQNLAGTLQTALTSSVNICDGNWHMITITRSTTTARLYIDGVLESTQTWSSSFSTSTSIVRYIYNNIADTDIFYDELTYNGTAAWTNAQITSIYNGYTPPSGDLTYNATPATASSEFGTDPVISTTSNFNYEQSFISVTALMTEPTIVTTSGDYVHIQTSITASAEFIFPLNYGGTTNISNAADLMTASAEMPEHPIITGSGNEYFANEATASAELIMPLYYGPSDKTIIASPMTATALSTGEINNPPNYRHLVKKYNPSFFLTNPKDVDPNNPTDEKFDFVNDGYGSWNGTISQSTQIVIANAPAPMIAIGNGKAVYKVGAATGDTEWAMTGATGLNYFNTFGNDFTLETWNYQGDTLYDNLIQVGGYELVQAKETTAFTYSGRDITCTPITQTGYRTIVGLKLITCGTFFEWNTYNQSFATQTCSTTNGATLTNSNNADAALNNASYPFPINQWNHYVITGTWSGNNLTVSFYLNGEIKATQTKTLNSVNFTSGPISFETCAENTAKRYVNQFAAYESILTNSAILEHYNHIASSSPNRTIDAFAMTASASLEDPIIVTQYNNNFPATDITASCELINPTIIAQINISNSTTPLTANGIAVEPFFYGNPDATIVADAATAYAEIPPNVYRLDTAYYSYVMQNIAPFRYVTFDSPNSNIDYGSDNDYGGAAPFVYNGTVTLPINGLNNNSLISDGLSYTTSGLIMKESEYNDDWNTTNEIWHTSFWIKKDIADTNPNGLRIVANLNGYKDNQHIILYQYNNMFYLSMNDKNHPAQTFASAVNVNVFDGNKHHIVITSKGDNKIFIYKNKIKVLEADYGSIHVVTTNSATSVPPNAETDNRARFAIGALITPYAETNLPAIPTPSIMYIDDAHWAVTYINETNVINLFNAMPYKVDINWFADPALSNFSEFVNPTFGTGFGHNAIFATASSELVNPTIYTEIEKIVNAEVMTANAEAIEPFSVIGDNITNINVIADLMLASALLLEHQGVLISIPGGPMLASANMISSKPYYDEYNLLIIQQTAMPLGASLFGKWSVGDIDS